MRSGLSIEEIQRRWGSLASSHAEIEIDVWTITVFVKGKTTERRNRESGEILYTSPDQSTEINEGGVIDG